METELKAPAKINLTLLVGEAEDGDLHPLCSLFSELALCDRLVVSPSSLPGVTLTGIGHDLDPTENSLKRAWDVFTERVSPRFAGVEIELQKRIPSAAGLGGGSSDAAVLLQWLANQTEVELGDEELVALGARVGADVPLFLSQASRGLMRGTGEQISEVNADWPSNTLLIYPRLEKSTAELYAELDERELTRSELPESVSLDLDDWLDDSGLLTNDFLPLWRDRDMESLLEIVAEETSESGLYGGLTGSGPTLFVLAERRSDLDQITSEVVSSGVLSDLPGTRLIDTELS